MSGRLALAWRRLFRHPQWNIGILHQSLDDVLREGVSGDERIQWFPLEGRREFFADPFAVVRSGTITILCERFSYRESRGHIASIEYRDGGFSSPATAIESPVHMSYPCVVEHEGRIHCVPETCAAREVAIYRAIDFPARWEKAGVLLADFPGIDPTVFFHDGRWWLLCTEHGASENTELLAWHAADLFGPWRPHAKNPVKTDVASARPGGAPFVHAGALHRPAQDCSRRYGGGIVILRVERLTPEEFVEEPVAWIVPPRASRYRLGRHTFSPAAGVILIDGHRAMFVWEALTAFLAICLRDLRGLVTGGR